MNKKELLQCPFCGMEPYTIEMESGFSIICSNCGIGHRENNWTKEYAIKSWNRRCKENKGLIGG